MHGLAGNYHDLFFKASLEKNLVFSVYHVFFPFLPVFAVSIVVLSKVET